MHAKMVLKAQTTPNGVKRKPLLTLTSSNQEEKLDKEGCSSRIFLKRVSMESLEVEDEDALQENTFLAADL